MELESSRLLPVDRERAWQALNDPEALKAAIPGCESIEKTGENEYTVVMTAAIGPVKAKFKGRLTLTDIVAPQSYTLTFDGQGGVAGFGKGTAHVMLVPEGSQTRLDYRVKAQVGGKIAQVGSRLIDSAARKVADDFFDAFTARLAPPVSAAQTGVQLPAPVTTGIPFARSPLFWAIVLALLAALWLALR